MKEIIYQMLPRYWGNADAAPQKGASLAVNGCGRFDDIDKDSLDYLKWLGCSYIGTGLPYITAAQPFKAEETLLVYYVEQAAAVNCDRSDLLCLSNIHI